MNHIIHNHLVLILSCKSWILKLASDSLLTYSASKILLSSAMTKGTSSCLLLPIITLLINESLSLTYFSFIFSFVSVTYNFLRRDSTSFLRFWISISKPILLFFYYARCFFLRISISFSKRLYFMCCYSIVFLREYI